VATIVISKSEKEFTGNDKPFAISGDIKQLNYQTMYNQLFSITAIYIKRSF